MTTTNESPAQLLTVAVSAANEAGRILKDGFGTSFSKTRKTGAHDLITEFDKLAEDIIESHLKNAFPKHTFLGEETGQVGAIQSTGTRWIIDPIDGTLNFCRSIPYFGVSIAAEKNGAIVCGVIFNPITGEQFTATRNGGAYLNGKQLQVSLNSTLNSSVIAFGFPFNTEGNPDQCLSHFAAIGAKGAQLLRMGSSAMNLAYVAAGRFDGFMETSCFPWDVAAGILMVAEAGGSVSNLDGSTYSFAKPGIIATNQIVHPELLAVVKRPKSA
jgi:myo-inositol-1(or 4)-monophosphatase